MNKKTSVFVVRPTNLTNVAQGSFRGFREQGRNPDTPGDSKNAPGPVSMPLKGAPQVPGDKPNPSKEG